MTPRGALALGALAAILLITAAWWALALWPSSAATPEWLLRTREVCFGAARNALPDAGGWILLVGEPVGLVAVLAVIWGDALREGLAAALARPAGRVILAGAVLAVAGGLGAAARLVAEVRGEPFALRTPGDVAGAVAAGRVDDKAPILSLVDQHGDSVSLGRFRGRPVIVTFAFGHCTTVCPLTVRAARTAARRLAGQGAVLLVITLDPWRDTEPRLPFLAEAWELGEGMHVLSGDVAVVERTLSAWRVPRARNPASGDVTHPSMVYVVSPGGRLAYALGADAEAIVTAVEALRPGPRG
ncbi:MAG TPA: SCO family protein [Gemmatimonadales bacterium]|nr:SCO family protein [Gemmatimonadales bacterium]